MQFAHQSTTAALFWFHTTGTVQLVRWTFNLGNMSRKLLTGRLWIILRWKNVTVFKLNSSQHQQSSQRLGAGWEGRSQTQLHSWENKTTGSKVRIIFTKKLEQRILVSFVRRL